MRVFIGYDKREDEAYRVACKTLWHTSGLIAEPLVSERLSSQGLLTRLVDARDGLFYDLPSNAHASTEFAVSRFLTPVLCQTGWALFTDCDVVFMQDVHDMLEATSKTKAVYVVKHDHKQDGVKMDGQPQVSYPRKNWSSVMLFNCDHPANQRLSLHDINTRPGRDLHRFYWLNDDEIGELDPAWNWLVNVQEAPREPKIAHFTLGGPWIPEWEGAPHDDIWRAA